MPDERPGFAHRARASIVLLAILCVAFAARVWLLTAGVPHAVADGEPQIVDRALRILHTGDWNPHAFDHPSLVIYVQAAVAIVRFLWGALNGEWASLDAYRIEAVYAAGRFTTATIGVATVWLVYRLGLEVGARRAALLGAALLAVHPLHVRESHVIGTGVPMTALATLAVWLAVRAARKGSVRAYAWAGIVCGLAGAAAYTGLLALVAAVAAWAVCERSSPDRWKKGGAIFGAAALAFLLTAPYTLLDMPAFLDGIAQSSRAARPSSVALLLAPMIDLFVAYAAVEAVRLAAARLRARSTLASEPALLAAISLLLLFGGVRGSVRWLDRLKQPDTRAIAAEWMARSTPPGTRIAVEATGPTYLDRAGLRVTATKRLIDHGVEWYRRHADYLIISSADLTGYGDYVAAGPTVFQIAPTPQRDGPPIVIVKLTP